jgi:hypothetical protein
MGSMVSQAGEKCYPQCEKSSHECLVHGILISPEPLRSRFSVRPRTTPLRPASFEAS